MIGLDLPDPDDRTRQLWQSAKPFPHLIVPGALSLTDAAACSAEFPPPDSGGWHTFHGPLEEGKQEGQAVIAGPMVAALHETFASELFVRWLRGVSGITDLRADPERVGGGIHQSGPGARLGRHVDFNLHPRRPDLIRAVNLIVFVGDHDRWSEAWNGTLQLGGGPGEYVVDVAPMPGTLVVFEASDTSWHGHPYPMSADAPLRKSVPAYYYRPVHAGEQVEPHSTRFLDPDRA